MKKHHSHLVTLFPLLANAVSLHTLFLFFAYTRNPVSDLAGLLIWWGCLTLIYIVLVLFLRCPRSLRGVIIIAASGFVLQLVLTVLFAHRPATFFSWVILLFMWICMYARCCTQLLEGIKPESVTAAFETTVLMLFVAAFAVTVSVMVVEPLICTAIGALFSLIAMAKVRSDNARVDAQVQAQQKGKFLLVGLLVGLGGIVTLLCVLLAGTASQWLTRLTQWVFSVLRAVAGTIGRFFRWLASLLPEKQIDPDLLKDPAAQLSGEAAEWGSFNSSLPFYVILGIVAISVLVSLCWLWRNGGFHRVPFHSRTTSRIQRKRPGLGQLLLRLWHRLRRWTLFQVSYLKLRNTPPGLFVWLERRMHTHHLDRQPGETSRIFLSRIRSAYPQCGESLSILADSLDQHYFGNGQRLSPDEIASMRKTLTQAFRFEQA